MSRKDNKNPIMPEYWTLLRTAAEALTNARVKLAIAEQALLDGIVEVERYIYRVREGEES